MFVSRGGGQYVGSGSEWHTLFTNRLYKPDGTKRLVIYFTGGPGDDQDFITASASGAQIAPQLADVGLPFASAAFGGAGRWGNDTATTRIEQLRAFAQTQLGTKTDKFIGIGVSKGATALLNYFKLYPQNVAALCLIVPAVNVSDIHDNNRSGLAAEIENAYGGLTAWNSAKPTRDPSLYATDIASSSVSYNAPIKLIYGNNDTTVTPAAVTGFVSSVKSYNASANISALSKGATDHLTTGPAIDPVEDVWKFLAPYST